MDIYDINLPLMMAAGFVALVSPGPATMALAGTSMGAGRNFGVAMALGTATGSWFWSITAALGFGALMASHVWLFEIVRWVGALYLAFLGIKSLRAAYLGNAASIREMRPRSLKRAYLKGVMIHITNPKAVLFFGSVYALGIPAQTPPQTIALVVCVLGLQSSLLFVLYAMCFSFSPLRRGYVRFARWFNGIAGFLFGAGAASILLARLPQ